MPVISFANPKGGSGKTTCALLLASQLAGRGARVSILDADPEHWISQWGERPGRPETVMIVSQVTEDSIVDLIDSAAASSQFVVVDLEGTANLLVAHAIAMSDLVVIPIQGSSMDAQGGAKVLRLVASQARLARRAIPHAVVLTRTNAAITSRSMRNVQAQLAAGGVDVFKTSIVERAAYRDLVDYGGTLAGLDPTKVSNLEKACDNAAEFAGEVLERLRAVEAQGTKTKEAV